MMTAAVKWTSHAIFLLLVIWYRGFVIILLSLIFLIRLNLKSFAIKNAPLKYTKEAGRKQKKSSRLANNGDPKKIRIRKNQLKLPKIPSTVGGKENFSEFLNNFIMRKFRDHKLRRWTTTNWYRFNGGLK